MLDKQTLDQYNDAVVRARSTGVAIVEALDHRELLLTVKRRHNITISTLEDLSRRLDRQSSNKLMSYFYGRVDGTAAEMFEAVKMWIDLVIRNQSNGSLSDI